MKTKHELRRVDMWNPSGGPRINVLLTPAAYRMGTEAAWPTNVALLARWWADVIREEAKREARKRRRALPRGAGFEANLERRAEELAKACLAELELHKLIFQQTAETFNRYAGYEKHDQLPGDPEAFWYGRGAVLESEARK